MQHIQIGRSLMTTFAGVNAPAANTRRHTDAEPPAMSNPFDWIVEKQTADNDLSSHLEALQHRDLTERAVRSIDDGNGRNATNTDCIKLLLCKSAPIVWGMQRAVAQQMKAKSSDYDNRDDVDDEDFDENQSGNGINAFFKHLPDVEEFKNHGDACEAQYKSCTIYS